MNSQPERIKPNTPESITQIIAHIKQLVMRIDNTKPEEEKIKEHVLNLAEGVLINFARIADAMEAIAGPEKH